MIKDFTCSNLINPKCFGLSVSNDSGLICLSRIITIVYPKKRKYTKKATASKPIETVIVSKPIEALKCEKSINSFDAIYKQYYYGIFNYIKKAMSLQIPITEELTNDVFIKVSQHLNDYDKDKSAISTWVYNIAKNVVIDYVRSERHHNEQKTNHISNYVNDNGVSSFDVVAPKDKDTIFRTETMNKIMASIEKLKDNERKVVEHIVLEDLSQIEVAEKMNISVNNVKQIYFRAKKELQIMLKRDYEMAWG